jgi:L-lactate dehydrogenase (cytochrome)
MRPVSHCDPSTTILGYTTSLPIFVSGSALAKLGHPDGELNITYGAYTSSSKHVIQMVSSNASLSFGEIAKAARQGQTLFFQLYKHHDDVQAEKRVRAVEEAGYKAIFLTVDAIVAGNRERDIRSPWVLEDEENGGPPIHSRTKAASPSSSEANLFGTAGALVANDDRNMTWEKVCLMFLIDYAIIRPCTDNTLAEEHHETANCYQRLEYSFHAPLPRNGSF